MPVGETRSVERETQGWVSPALQAKQDSEARQARRATGRGERAPCFWMGTVWSAGVRAPNRVRMVRPVIGDVEESPTLWFYCGQMTKDRETG